MKQSILILGITMMATVTSFAQTGTYPEIVTIDSGAPLLDVKVVIPAGSAYDPVGMEGLAYLTGRLIIDGGFGDPDNPITKEKLAEITQPWGSGAYPSVSVTKEITVYSIKIPREVLPDYVDKVLKPMFTTPLFSTTELERLQSETVQVIRTARLEEIEFVGLVALDAFIHEGTRYAHPDIGTVEGLKKVSREAIQQFYDTHYRSSNFTVGVTSKDADVVRIIHEAFQGLRTSKGRGKPKVKIQPPTPVEGRSVLILVQPNAISTGIHAGFPIALTRRSPDYWPLYIANIWFGTHRDSFSHLYQVLREARGYNYGDYSYIEHFEDRPSHLFPPTLTPRQYQYFSIWIRPVAHNYAHHILKALTWELENFVRTGLTQEQCKLAKNKARVLYLSLAETTERILGYKLDDRFYGLEAGYLDSYLKAIDGVNCETINNIIRKYLQADNLKYVVVTDDSTASKLAQELEKDVVAWGKHPEDYQIDTIEKEGQKIYEIPENKLELLYLDAVWAHYPLAIPSNRIRIVPVKKMFETATIP